MIKYLINLIFALCLFGQSSFASETAGSQIVKSDFKRLRHLNGLKKPLIADGEIIIDSQRGVLWKIIKPFPLTIVLQKGQVTVWKNGSKENVTSQNVQFLESLIPKLMQSLFTAQFTQLDGFNCEDCEQSSPLTDKEWCKLLTPQFDILKKMITSFKVVGVKGEKNQVSQIVISRPTGDFDTLKFSNQTELSQLSEDDLKYFDSQ